MGHLHFPDGFLPLWLWLGCTIAVVMINAVILARLSTTQANKRIPLAGVMGALMIVGMSLEIVPLAYHLNLAVPVGILLGPVLAFLSVLSTNIFLALLGHGGITTIGLNTLILGGEALLGWTLFHLLFKNLSLHFRAFTASFVALTITHVILISALTFLAPQLMHHDETESELIRFELIAEQDAHEEAEETEPGNTGLARFAMIMFSLSTIGALLESTLSAYLIAYIGRLKPDLLSRKV